MSQDPDYHRYGIRSSAGVWRTEKMAVITVPTGGRGPFSPLRHIWKAFGLAAPTHTSVTAALGTMQIMAGLFNIGLGPGRTSTGSGDLSSLGAAYWLGAVFIVTGIMSILAGQFPSSCLVGFAVFMNLAGAIFAVTGVALYAVDLRKASVLWMCERSDHDADRHGDDDDCTKVALFAQAVLTSMDTTLVAAAVLHLFGDVVLAVLGIEALVSGDEGGRRVDQEDNKQNVQLDLEDFQKGEANCRRIVAVGYN